MNLYLESSAVLAWLLGEPGGDLVRTRVAAADVLLSSVLTLTEARRALVRAEHLGILKARDGERLRGMLARSERSWVLMEISADVRARAEGRFPVEPVRTLDALHLATALLFTSAYEDVSILTFDDRIARNAEALGVGGPGTEVAR